MGAPVSRSETGCERNPLGGQGEGGGGVQGKLPGGFWAAGYYKGGM